MAGAKIIVLYPYPADVGSFEQAYTEEHMPMVNTASFPGITRFVGTRVLGTPDGSTPPFYRIAELHFPSLGALQAAAAGPGGQKAVAHAGSISTGGPPIVLVADDEPIEF